MIFPLFLVLYKSDGCFSPIRKLRHSSIDSRAVRCSVVILVVVVLLLSFISIDTEKKNERLSLSLAGRVRTSNVNNQCKPNRRKREEREKEKEKKSIEYAVARPLYFFDACVCASLRIKTKKIYLIRYIISI